MVDAGFEETGVAKFALLDPAAEISSLEQVFIITEYTTDAAAQGSQNAQTGINAAGGQTQATDPSATVPSETTPVVTGPLG